MQYSEVVGFIRQLYQTPTKPIYLHEPIFIGNEKKYVIEAIDSTFVSSVGKFVDRFEEMMQEITGAKYAVATSNGTSALHIALILAGVQQNDLVITQPLSFIATCNAISYLKAQPVFVDVSPNTLGLCPQSLQQFLQTECTVENNECLHKTSRKKIAACVPMHTFGLPTAIDEIVSICNQYHIPVIEDAAESIGSKYKNQHTGTFGLIGTFSFNGNKTVTSGGGGCIVTNNEQLAKRAKHLTTQAKIPHRWEFRHDEIGYNYRMPNLNAALACAQLEMLDTYVASKRNIAQQYQTFFSNSNIKFISEPEHAFSNYWLNAVMLSSLKERDEFLQYTNDKGIITRPVWTLMQELDMFKDCLHTDLYNAKHIEDCLVNLPSSVIIKN